MYMFNVKNKQCYRFVLKMFISQKNNPKQDCFLQNGYIHFKDTLQNVWLNIVWAIDVR